LIRPTLEIAVSLNASARRDDEWFDDDPDDLERLRSAMEAISDVEDPVSAAAILAFRVTRAPAFSEGNKRTAFLLAKWILARNGQDGLVILPPDDRLVADLLVKAAAGQDIQSELEDLVQSRRPQRP
jgi:prophage maintenance system killer protein